MTRTSYVPGMGYRYYAAQVERIERVTEQVMTDKTPGNPLAGMSRAEVMSVVEKVLDEDGE